MTPSTSSVLINALPTYVVPKDHIEAMRDGRWKQAMVDEITALQNNKTWTLVELPTGKKIVGCRWVYAVKLKADASLDRVKARLVATVDGYMQ